MNTNDKHKTHFSFPTFLYYLVFVMFDSILSISADIETIGEILKKIIPTLEEVGSFFYVFVDWGGLKYVLLGPNGGGGETVGITLCSSSSIVQPALFSIQGCCTHVVVYIMSDYNGVNLN